MPAVRSIAPSRSFAALVASLALAATACSGTAPSPSVAPSVAPPASPSEVASPSEAASPSAAESPSEAASPSAEPSGSAASGGGNAVTIVNFSFGPNSLTVSKGTTVTWTNQDDIGHTVTFDQGGDGSGTLNKGATFEETFKTAGTFAYHCKIHPSMTGTVTVTG